MRFGFLGWSRFGFSLSWWAWGRWAWRRWGSRRLSCNWSILRSRRCRSWRRWLCDWRRRRRSGRCCRRCGFAGIMVGRKKILIDPCRSTRFCDSPELLFFLSRNREVRLDQRPLIFWLRINRSDRWLSRSRLGWAIQLDHRRGLAMRTSHLLAVHLLGHPELPTAAGASERLRFLSHRSRWCRRGCKRIRRNLHRLRTRRALDNLSSLRSRNLKWLLAIRASKNKRTQITYPEVLKIRSPASPKPGTMNLSSFNLSSITQV